MKQVPIKHQPQGFAGLRSDQYILLGLALFGFLGSMYLIQKCKFNAPVAIPGQSIIYAKGAFAETSVFQNNVLDIDGSLQEKSPLQFALSDNLQLDKYLVDFGNGDQRIYDKNSFVYIYDEPGNYKLQLMEMKDNRLQMIESRNVLICKNNMYH